MKPVAIVAAMHEELAAILALMPDEAKRSVANRDFWAGHLHGKEVVVVLSRIGKVAAATTATVLIERFGVQRIVFTGVAGGIAPGLRVGDVVVADSFLQHDMDASPIFPRHEIPLYGLSRFAADAGMAASLADAAERVLRDPAALIGADAMKEFAIAAPKVYRGLIASGDRFVSSAREVAALRQSVPDALAVEMEGAAIAQVCHDYGIPFAAVRMISDSADDDAHVDFPRIVSGVARVYSARIVEAWLDR